MTAQVLSARRGHVTTFTAFDSGMAEEEELFKSMLPPCLHVRAVTPFIQFIRSSGPQL